MVSTNLHCRLCVGIAHIGSIPLEGLNGTAAQMVGGGFVNLFSGNLRPPAKADFC